MSKTADSHTPDTQSEPKVLSARTRNPGVRTIAVGRPDPSEASFVRATTKGMKITVRHFFENLFTRKHTETVQYPDETVTYPPRYRGIHRLMTRDDGSVRCVACMCCPTICPANCITIIPAESDDPTIEKYPAIFEIDELRCVACGLCVEACPCDAIRMDTGEHTLPVEFRGDAIEDKESLMSRGEPSRAVQGGAGASWRENRKRES